MARLLILYLLLEGARSAYELKRVLASPYLTFWFRIEDPSIYSALKTLAKNGYATAKKSGRATRYRVMRKGVEEFDMALEQAWETGEGRVFDAALAVSGDLPSDELGELMARRQVQLERRLEQLHVLKDGAMSSLLARKEQAFLETEITWLQQEQDKAACAG